MKHARADYDRIQDPEGTIPADEPVFLLRAQDSYAARAVKFYAQVLVQDDAANRPVYEMAMRQAEAMALWPIKEPPSVPSGADVSRETKQGAQAQFHAMLAGVVMDFVGYLTSDGAGEFEADLDGGEDEPPRVAFALLEAFTGWAKARGIPPHASQDWRKLLAPAAPSANQGG
jgi:hypothetical protein